MGRVTCCMHSKNYPFGVSRKKNIPHSFTLYHLMIYQEIVTFTWIEIAINTPVHDSIHFSLKGVDIYMGFLNYLFRTCTCSSYINYNFNQN